jgi:hypothetical protein
MDVYLAREAHRALEAVGLFPRKKGTCGFLLGHARGHRFMIEGVFPAPGRALSSLEEYYALDRLFEGRIIGFFAFAPAGPARRRLFAPFAAGKAYLEISPSRSSRKLKIAASVVDFDGRFHLLRLPLRKEPAAASPARNRP